MKLGALALDYDGTIATDGILEPAVREAIGDARRRGIVVALVTGRRIDDLRRVAGDLGCFDVVVAENGGVLEYPGSGRHVALSHPPNAAFVDEMRRHGIDVGVGETLVEMDQSAAPTALDVLQRLELPLVLAFNRSRLMVLPQAVAKSTGLRHALRALRLSIHNTVGIGDAENDHDLLDACEVGVAVAWGSPALQTVADEVIAGPGPAAVAEYIRTLVGQSRLSAGQMGRRRMLLGFEHDGSSVRLAIRGRTVLIAGEPASGKSWLAGVLCEQLILQEYCLCVVDPEGDYGALEALPGVMVVGGEELPPTSREIAKAFRHPDVSVVIDLSRMSHRHRAEYLKAVLPLLAALRRRTGLPHKILLDEAHYYLNSPDSARLIDPELAGYILVTYRISALTEAIQTTTDAVVMVTRESDPHEAETLLGLCRPELPSDAGRVVFRELAATEAALLPGPEEAGGRIRRFRLAPRLTAHVRHQSKYLDVPVLDYQSFVFTDGGRQGPRARTLKEFMGLLAALPEDRLRPHMQRHDFSRWLADVFRDHSLAARVRDLEGTASTEDTRDIAASIAQAIRARYEIVEGSP